MSSVTLSVAVAVCHGLLQQAVWQIQGGGQTNVPEDHLQVADLRISLLRSQGERPPTPEQPLFISHCLSLITDAILKFVLCVDPSFPEGALPPPPPSIPKECENGDCC